MAFNKEIWKAQKLSSFRLNMKAQLAGQIQDPSELIDKLSDEYEATIDKMFADHAQMSMEIQAEIQANKALKDYYAKVGGYKDNMLIFIDDCFSIAFLFPKEMLSKNRNRTNSVHKPSGRG